MEARNLLREHARPFELTLRIRHPSIDPDEISRELQLEPEHSFRAGEPRESSSGIAAAAVHAESYWLAALDPNSFSVGALAGFDFPKRSRFGPSASESKDGPRAMLTNSLGLALTLGTIHFLRGHADFVRRVQSEGGEVALIVELPSESAHSFTLTPQVTKVLSELGVAVDFEFTNE